MKRLMIFSAGVLFAAILAQGAPIGQDDARTAARNWLNGEAMIAEGISAEVESVRTEEDGSGVSYHVVSLTGGGFVILSADDGIEPVIAFSARGTFPQAGTEDPVRALLARDLGERTDALNAGGGAFKRMVFSTGSGMTSSPEAKWARLLTVQASNVKLRAYSNGRASIPDVRVAPLVQSQWGQENDSGYSNTGSPCYSYYTPGNSPCGCVATAMAQIMRYWQYPNAIGAFSRKCEVNGSPTVLSVTAGAYDWGNMPLDPSKGTSEAQRQAIGKLTYDCGVAMYTSYTETGSGSLGGFAFKPFLDNFGYANALTYCPDDISLDDIEQSVYPNFDAGCPVLMGFSDGWYSLHEVLADGYGYVSDTPYVHLNVGWTAISGSDLWYNLPRVTFTLSGSQASSFSVIDHFIYNIFTDETGDILSGRVTDKDGKAAAGVEVTVCKSGSTSILKKTTTSQSGIYAFVLPGNAKYDVSVNGVVKSGIYLKKSVNPRAVDFETGSYSPTGMTCGNSWGNDFVLGETPEPEPEPEPEPSTEPTLDVSCALDGAELVLGQAVTFPVEITCTACSVKSVKASGLPSGLKLVSGKKAAPYAYVITGTPKKAALKPFAVKLTIQAKADDAKIKVPNTVIEYAVSVLPLDDWAVGTFSGMADIDGTAATFTMTVKNTGAISGKVMVNKKSASFKANGFSTVSDALYRVEVDGVFGDKLAVEIVPREFGDDEVGAITNGYIRAAQEIWKLKEYKKFLSKYTSPDKTLSWTAAGKVTWTTQINGKKAKLTATLLPVAHEDGMVSLCAYFVANGAATRLDVRYAETAPASPDISFTPVN